MVVTRDSGQEMLRRLYGLYDRSRRPLRNRSYFVLPHLGMAYARIPGVCGCARDPILRRLARLEYDHDGTAPERYMDTPCPYAALACVEARDLKRTYSNLMVLAILKDPIQRILTCYYEHFCGDGTPSPRLNHYGLGPDTPLERFVRRIRQVPDFRADNYFRSQIDILSYKGEFLPDFVLATNQLEAGLQGLRAILLHRAGVEIGHFSSGELQDYFSLHFQRTDNVAEVEFHLANRYKSDLEMFTRHATGSV